MFQTTRSQLTLAYMIVLIAILSVFTIAVRLTFARSLNQQLNERLVNLAQNASFEMEREKGKLNVDENETIISEDQAVEWFDLEAKIVEQQGKHKLDVPLNIKKLSKIQSYSDSIRSITIPVYSLDDETELIGYVRVSQSLVELNGILRRLDYGLESGIAIALLASGLSGIWLTRRAMQPIESSFERLKQFTADASHELRSPLMAIKTNADVALKYPEGMRDSDEEKFTAISSASNQMTKLTENLLFLTRTDKSIALQKELVDLHLILSEITQLYKIQAWEQNLTWQEQLEPNLWISGDSMLLKQLFTNLLQNALYYTPAGGAIAITATKVNYRLIKVEIKDTGIGIAPENLDKIFERFWRADKSRSYQTGKSGLGLSIVKEIILLHRSKIFVTSELEKGSCFTIIFTTFKYQAR